MPELTAQTTQGLILGRITDANTGDPLAGVTVTCTGETLSGSRTVVSNGTGYYSLTFLSPGTYRMRVTLNAYQAQTIYNIRIGVAARLDLDFALRARKYVFESGNYRQLSVPNSKTILPFFGPDVDPSRSGVIQPDEGKPGLLETSVSEVISRNVLDTLPLAGRDAYALLLTQPGVTADTTTSRGLGLSVNGQRPSASNYLLDGFDNNNHLTTGPLALTAPEMIQEYRLSTNNFSAEYGGASGFIANAISRPGTQKWHGLLYGYLGNELLNANSFQSNVNGFPRPAYKSLEGGALITGPLVREKLFESFSFDRSRLRDRLDPVPVNLPSAYYLASQSGDSYAAQLLTTYHPDTIPTQDSTQYGCKTQNINIHCVPLRPLDSLDSLLFLPRIDGLARDGRDHWYARVTVSRSSRDPGYLYTPYEQFATRITDNESSAGLRWISSAGPRFQFTAGVGWAATTFLVPRPHDDVPELIEGNAALPGAPLAYSTRNLDRRPEGSGDAIWSVGAQLVKAGGSVLFRQIENQFEVNNSGEFNFASLQALTLSQPASILLGVARQDGSADPLNNRRYENTQWSAYVQDTFKLTSRMGINAGVRVEEFGYPRNNGASGDATLRLGTGQDPDAQVRSASIVYGGAPFYRSLPVVWAPRLGVSYRLDARGDLIARAAWGLFFDQPFDNLWENGSFNSLQTATLTNTRNVIWTGQPPPGLLSAFGPSDVSRSPDYFTAFAPSFHAGRVQSYLLGIEKHFTRSLSVEVETLGSSGSGLITTNVLNRNDNVPLSIVLRSNRLLPLVAYRGNQGDSSYHALASVLRYRSSRALFQLSWTWSHSIDNQSEPLAGEFGNLAALTSASGSFQTPPPVSTFMLTSPGPWDRGDSDFDQRQNLVGFGSFALPRLFHARALTGWRFSGLGALRSGLPFSVLEAPGLSNVYNQRANLIDPGEARLQVPGSVPGTRLLLNPAAFSRPAAGSLGNSGRNSFRSPGFYSLDGSLSRTFVLPHFREHAAATVRIDAINLLNHTNLNTPANAHYLSTFGQASYGLQENDAVGSPASSPLAESSRQLRLVLRIAF